MTLFKGLVALAVSAVVSTTAGASEMTAGDLYQFCVSTDGTAQNVCSKYILGAVQGMNLAAGKLGDKTTFCIPDDIPESFLVDTFISAARAEFAAYPQDKSIPAISLIGAITVHAFPCR